VSKKPKNYVLATLKGEQGHECLAKAFHLSFLQAASPKAKALNRHASELEDGSHTPFDSQPIMQLSRMYGVGALMYQAAKKMEESQRMAPEKALHELRGAMVYTAAAMLRIDEDAGGGLIDELLEADEQ